MNKFPQHRHYLCQNVIFILLLLSLAAQSANAALVRGRLLRNNAPASGVAVTVYAASFGRSTPAYSGGDGMYYINGVPPGGYYLEVWISRDPRVLPAVYQIQVNEPYTDVSPLAVP